MLAAAAQIDGLLAQTGLEPPFSFITIQRLQKCLIAQRLSERLLLMVQAVEAHRPSRSKLARRFSLRQE